MIKVLAILDTLLEQYTTWSYSIRNHFRHNDIDHYNINVLINGFGRIVISDTLDPNYVEVWTNVHPTEEDGVRVKKSSLLEYIIFISKEDFSI